MMKASKKYGPYNQYVPYKDVVYRLIGYYVYLGDHATYPSFDTHKIEESIHHTLDDAKQRMSVLIKNKQHPVYHWHRFLISEVPIGTHCSSNWEGQKCWSYDCKGDFVAETKVSSVPDCHDNREIYWGREPDECRFKVGDVVEVILGDKVELHMIWRLPFGLEYAKTRLPEVKPEKPMPIHLDDSDDNYITVCLDAIYPDHVHVMSCFPAGTLPLDETIVKKLQEIFDRCNEEDTSK